MTRTRSRMDKLNNNIILLVSSFMSRCQNSQSNSQSYKKLLKLLKWNSNQKEIEKKVTKKASPSLSPFSITHTVPWSHGPECCWFQCCKAALTLAECWVCSFWSCQSLQPQRNQIPSALEQTEHLWLMWWKSRDVSVRVETWLLPERLSASDIRRWCSYEADSKETILSNLRWPKFSATFASRRREMYVFRPGWLENLHYNPAFSR